MSGPALVNRLAAYFERPDHGRDFPASFNACSAAGTSSAAMIGLRIGASIKAPACERKSKNPSLSAVAMNIDGRLLTRNNAPMSFVRCGLAVLLGFLAGMARPMTVSAATIRDDEPDSAYVTLGNNPAFASVGTLVNSWGYTGCGILIAPGWVLTAAHLFTAASSATFTIGGTSYTSTQLFTDPSWDGNASDGSDFGLVHLSSSLTAIPPPPLYTGPSLLGQTGTFVGFGFTGTGLTGWKTSRRPETRFSRCRGCQQSVFWQYKLRVRRHV